MRIRVLVLGSLLLSSLSVVACGGGAADGPGAVTPNVAGASPGAAPTADPSLPKPLSKPDSARCTWKREGAKACKAGAVGGDLSAAVTTMANACVDTKKMKMVGTPLTGEGTSTNNVKSMPLPVQANHCYRVLGLAEASVTDFDIAFLDSEGKSCGEDLNDSNEAVLLEDGVICFTKDDTMNINAAVANGTGKWAIEVWSD